MTGTFATHCKNYFGYVNEATASAVNENQRAGFNPKSFLAELKRLDSADRAYFTELFKGVNLIVG